jgi:ectoine hydroxylase-related dioxygenase (phytanoyl-CoA dioxygenase family)
MTGIRRYGVGEQRVSTTMIDRTIEQVSLLGFAVVDAGYTHRQIEDFAAAFDRAARRMEDQHGGPAALAAIDEHHTIRLPMLYERVFLELALNPIVLEIVRRMIGDYVILNQQNGVTNPPSGTPYSQGRYHRDLPYQHFVASRPLGLTALFCLDSFTTENGATWVIPGSHKQEAFPSDAVVEASQIQATAAAGSFIVLDSMAFHAGGVNRTSGQRRAVNQVFTIPLIKQQIALSSALGDAFASDPAHRRLLGYEVSVPRDVAAYYASRRAKTI